MRANTHTSASIVSVITYDDKRRQQRARPRPRLVAPWHQEKSVSFGKCDDLGNLSQFCALGLKLQQGNINYKRGLEHIVRAQSFMHSALCHSGATTRRPNSGDGHARPEG